MKLGRWRLWTLAGIAAAIGVAIVAANRDSNAAAPLEPRPAPVATAGEPPPKARAAEPGRVELERLARSALRREAGREPVDAFGATTWQVVQAPAPTEPAPAPARPVKPPPPAPPSAPALPFTYLGRFEDAAAHMVMLVKGDRIHAVASGDVIEGTYRVDRIDDQQVELTYLPLDQKQSLPTGGRS